MYSISGKLKLKTPINKISAKFQKRDFVIEVIDGRSAQVIQLQLTQDNCLILDQFKENQFITVQFDIKGREWKSPSGEIKYFNTLEADSIIEDESATKLEEANNQFKNDDELPF